MTVPNNTSKNTTAFFIQAATAFGTSLVTALGGIIYLPLDAWQRMFLGITVLFLVSSAFTLAKVIRDQQEAATVRVRLSQMST
ncbi:YiaA/YiaB family inner membrane protein [Mycobacterium sp. 050134]|uniref:YiaA/YiaB family inner membrane protein n=1 Tax=Mycobacterium sp. 050134 TaxID=3096111 RepID=UPI002EDA2984